VRRRRRTKKKKILNFSLKFSISISISKREVVGAYPVALETAYLLRNTVSLTKWHTPEILRDIVKHVAKTVAAANPLGSSSFLPPREKNQNSPNVTILQN